jgi:hypothetical protein
MLIRNKLVFEKWCLDSVPLDVNVEADAYAGDDDGKSLNGADSSTDIAWLTQASLDWLDSLESHRIH